MKRFIALVIVVLIIIFTVDTAFAHNSLSLEICDVKTDMAYSVRYENKNMSVEGKDGLICRTVMERVTGVSIYDGILYIYYADNLNRALSVYCYDFYGDSTESYVINKNAFANQYCFACDGEVVYFASKETRNMLCIYKDGIVSEVDFKAHIKQIFYTGKSLGVITTMGTFLYSQGEIFSISSPLSVPVNYIGNGIFKDSENKLYEISENNLIEISDETDVSATTETIPEASALKSEFYIAYCGETVSKIKKAFADSEITEIRKADGKIIESGKVGTGTTLTFTSEEVVKVLIYGEVTGEGNINSRDLKALLNHLSGKEILTGDFLVSADIDNDGKITTKDALMTANMY